MSHATDTIPKHATAQLRHPTPLGPLLLVRTATGLAGAWFEGQQHHPAPMAAPLRPDDALLRRAAAQLDAYFAGDGAGFELELDLHGTPFQRAVWTELLGIARAGTRSYGEIARRLGQPSAGRAVGAAVGRNPLSIIVPCHRVVGSDGSLTGYAGGLERKTALLRLEGLPARARAEAPQQLEMH